jgi:hypothetical protein
LKLLNQYSNNSFEFQIIDLLRPAVREKAKQNKLQTSMASGRKKSTHLIRTRGESGISEQYRQLLQQEAALKNDVTVLRKLSRKHHQALRDSRLMSLDLEETLQTEATWNPCKEEVLKSYQLPNIAPQKSTVKSITRQNDRLVKSKTVRLSGYPDRWFFPSIAHAVPHPLKTYQTPHQVHRTDFRLPKLPCY